MIGKAKIGAAASLLALAAAGCATTPEQRYSDASSGSYYNPSYPDADRIFRNGYVDATRPLSAAHAAMAVDARTLAAYEGIEGARLAHQVYAEAQAEKLDGACERYVKIVQGETLYDIASLCDVPVYMLMDYNPSIDSPRHVFDGQTVEVPYMVNGDRLAYAQEAGLINAAASYVVQPGDTLSSIAAAHLAPAYSIADLNPEVDWRALPIGAQILIPAEPAVLGVPGTPRAKPISSYLGDGDFSGRRGWRRGGEGNTSEIEKLMPYKLKPVGAEEPTANDFGGMLTVDKTIVSPGQRVFVSASGLPANSNVTISRGANRAELRTVETVRTGPDGTLNAGVRVPRRADMGGVVITATVDRTGETLYSERVGVLGVDDGQSLDEDLEDALED
ncbi:MAG: LysM domain-containing protein [Amphiplicatus sp.]